MTPRQRLLVLGGALAAGAAAGATYRRRSGRTTSVPVEPEDERRSPGWGADVGRPDHRVVRTLDGAQLAVWDLQGDGTQAAVVVLPHCWGGSHEIWLPVTRRLRDRGHRVVLYDQRGHGASTRGTAPLAIETLAHDLAHVLETQDVTDAVLAGHSMGGMTIMSLATHRPEVMKERARAAVLVATSAHDPRAQSFPQAARLASAFIASPVVTRSMRSANGHRFVRRAFGVDPLHSHLVLTRDLFAGCDPSVRGGWLAAMTEMNLLEGIAAMEVPTTVMVGSRDMLTVPARADAIASSIPQARLVTLPDRGHMLPLEDPDAVADEILRAVGRTAIDQR